MAARECKKLLRGVINPILAIGVATVVGGHAMASGFEKSIMWGAQSAGRAGIAAADTTGSEALYFNPAGLASGTPGMEVSLNASPTWLNFSGPIDYNDDSVSSSTILVPMGLIFSQSPTDNFGYGVGYFISGGAKDEFDSVNFGLAQPAFEETDVAISEVSAGVGFKVNDRLKLGASWRYTMTSANIAVVQATGSTSAVANPIFTQLKGNDFSGFRLGAQYKVDDHTRLGLSYRSEVGIAAAGNVGGNIITSGAALAIDPDTATFKTTFPMQVVLAGEHELSDVWHLYGEYSWTQYSRVGEVTIDGNIVCQAASVTNNGHTYMQTNWQDQHRVALGGEYLGISWPVRFGAAWTSYVTDANYARAQFAAPAPAYTLTAGTGQDFHIDQHALRFNIAAEYSWLNGSGNGGAAGDATNNTRSGTYSDSLYVLHTSLAYNF